MKTIEYSQWEINDMIRFLEYAKNKKKEDYQKGKINLNQYNYELGLIRDLTTKMPIKTFKNEIKEEVKDNKIIDLF